MSSEETARQTVFFNNDGSYDRTREAEGPRISVKVVRDGEVGGKAVKNGQTISLCERDAIRERCWNFPPVIEIDALKLTRMGCIFLKSRGHGFYREPVGDLGFIPKIKVIGKVDNALVGSRVLMEGEVQEVPEDVAWALLRRRGGGEAEFAVHPDADFSLPAARLTALVDGPDFDIYYNS